MLLSEVKCKNAKPKEKAWKMSDGHGLYMEVQPSGSKYWRFKYRFLGKEKKLAIGVYPDTSLAMAREKRDEARRLLAMGKDPSKVKRENKLKALQEVENTFERLGREWFEKNKARWTPKHAQDIIYRLEKDVFKDIGKMPVREITPSRLLQTIRKIEARGAHELARRSRGMCEQIFAYGIGTEKADRNIAQDLRGTLEAFKRGHMPAIDTDEIPEFLDKLETNSARLYPQTIRATKLLMLTFVRTSELRHAKWEEFDFERAVWEIPGERMKMRKPHIVPLSTQTIALLKQQQEETKVINTDWVFPNQVRPRTPMSEGTVLGAIKRLGYKGRMTGHGFRALAMSTIKERLGYRHEVVDRQLAHAPRNKIDAAYDRAKFLDERKVMMQEWADYLDRVAKGEVVEFSKYKKLSSH
ncbi:MAG: integrase arm-type DNA-binding domain-containing protein [Pseudobdellovibrionaceae bacterium]